MLIHFDLPVGEFNMEPGNRLNLCLCSTLTTITIIHQKSASQPRFISSTSTHICYTYVLSSIQPFRSVLSSGIPCTASSVSGWGSPWGSPPQPSAVPARAASARSILASSARQKPPSASSSTVAVLRLGSLSRCFWLSKSIPTGISALKVFHSRKMTAPPLTAATSIRTGIGCPRFWQYGSPLDQYHETFGEDQSDLSPGKERRRKWKISPY